MSVSAIDPALLADLPADLPIEDRPPSGVARWGGSLLVALGVHAAAAVAMVAWHVPLEPIDAEPPAVLLELAPLPVAPPEPTPVMEAPPPEPPTPEPPTPEPVVEPPPPEPLPPEPPPPEPVIEPPPEPIVEPPPPEPPPVVEPEVVLPKPPPDPPKPKPEPKKEPPKPKVERPKPPPRPVPQTATVAPSAPAPAPAPIAAAPAPSAAPSRAVPSWQGRVLGHLERHKRYPRSAQARRQEGVSQVRFTIDREGRVLSVRLDKGSGYEVLDEETVEMVRRASPLPAPPEEMKQDRIELVVPVQFFLK